MKHFDAIVIGTGGVGSAATYHLARAGLRVLGLDRFPGGHDRGSSHGQTRVIRKAYFEHPDYVPLLVRSYELWRELEQRQNEALFHEVGLVEVGPPDGIVIPGVLASARQHALPIDTLTAADVSRRFPGLHVPDDGSAVFEREAGFLMVERCVLSHLRAAADCGAVLAQETVTRWEAEGDGVAVQTDRETYHAGLLVVTAGAWAATMLAELGVSFQVVRKHLHWFACDDARYRLDRGFPTFFFERPEGFFYGFPQLDGDGVKVAHHGPGTAVADPLRDDRTPEADDDRRVAQFMAEHLPGVDARRTRHEVCFYTLSPDEHFVVDRHPAHPQVAFAAGLSGHGFKCTSALGEALAQLAQTGRTRLPTRFLGLDRFA